MSNDRFRRLLAGFLSAYIGQVLLAQMTTTRTVLLHMRPEFAPPLAPGIVPLKRETAAVGLTWALHLVANDPVVQQRLGEECERVLGDGPLTSEAIEKLDLHLKVIKESLRPFPPIALMQRTVTRAVRVGDISLTPGDEVVCAIYVMHRSERLWDRPALFDPERFAPAASRGRHRFAFLPFGAGQHACLGMPLAYAEMVGIRGAWPGF